MTDSYQKLVDAIIKSVTRAVGPVAVMLANQVPGLTASPYKITIKGEPVKVIKELIKKYQKIIGPTAITLAKKGAAPIIKKNKKLKVPKELK